MTGSMDIALHAPQPATVAAPMPIVTFDDWRMALMGHAPVVQVQAPPVIQNMVSPETAALFKAPPLAEVVPLGFAEPKPRRLRQLVRSPRKILQHVENSMVQSQAKQTFAGIAVLVMLLIWAI